MTPAIKQRILDTAVAYGTGRDTLRCLALATADTPMNPKVSTCRTGLTTLEQ